MSSQNELGRVEQFMIGLIKMPDYSTRLRVLRTKKMFEELEAEYKPMFELLHTAMSGNYKLETADSKPVCIQGKVHRVF